MTDVDHIKQIIDMLYHSDAIFHEVKITYITKSNRWKTIIMRDEKDD